MKSSVLPNLALSGKSGSGKTTLADYLVDRYGYCRCSTGDICRKICNLLYGEIKKEKMNHLTSALREMDKHVLTRAALYGSKNGMPIVFDSLRFAEDLEFVERFGYITIRIECDEEERWGRLESRGEIYNRDKDEKDISETELDGVAFTCVLDNNLSPASKNIFLSLEDIIKEYV